MTWRKRNGEREYDELVDWDRRLSREAPFFQKLFAEHHVETVVDVGAGSARHAIMFRSWGLDVWAIDPSPDMLELARDNAKRLSSDVRIVQGGFGEVAGIVGEKVDAVTCTGNALPHVRSIDGLRSALSDLAEVLRPGGVLVLHYLNHYRLITHRVRTMQPVFRETPEGDKFFLRVLDYTPERDGILFDFVTLARDARVRDSRHTLESWPETLSRDPSGGWDLRSRRSLHLAIPHDVISRELETAGFGALRLFGDHSGKDFDRDADESIIVVAERS
ncbi:MAG: class I SAM-dependent methyltransferase [Coriobacteriales bacterium]|nr:class I SAM-dependent methyltransferase [Actinomycetes bacterium]